MTRKRRTKSLSPSPTPSTSSSTDAHTTQQSWIPEGNDDLVEDQAFQIAISELVKKAVTALDDSGNMRGTLKLEILAYLQNIQDQTEAKTQEWIVRRSQREAAILYLKLEHTKELYEQECRHSAALSKVNVPTPTTAGVSIPAPSTTSIPLSLPSTTASIAIREVAVASTSSSPPTATETVEVQSKKDLYSYKVRHTIVVQGKNPMASEAIEKAVKSSVNVATLGIGITGFKKAQKNKVIVQCDTEDQCRRFKEEVAKHSLLNAEEGQKQRPKIIIKGIDSSMKKEEVVSALFRQNRILQEFTNIPGKEELASVLFFLKYKTDAELQCAVLSVSPSVWKKLTETRKINIGYHRAAMSEYISVTKCQKCLGYGHRMAQCRNKEACWRCGGPHKAAECQSNADADHCSNCVKTNKTGKIRLATTHRALSEECPSHQRQILNYRATVDYGQ